MRRIVLILCVLGLFSLAIGGALVLASSEPSLTIPTSGTIANATEPPPQPPGSEQTYHPTQLNQIGYLAISASVVFLAAAFVFNNRKPSA